MSNLDRYFNWRKKRDETFRRGEDSLTRAAPKDTAGQEIGEVSTENAHIAAERSPAASKSPVSEDGWLYHEIAFPQTIEAYREQFRNGPIGKWRTDDECWLPARGYRLLVLPDGTGCIGSNSDGLEVPFQWRPNGDLCIECRMEDGEWDLVEYDFDSYRDEHDKEFIFLYDTSHNYSFWGIAHHRPMLLSRIITSPGEGAESLTNQTPASQTEDE